MEKIQLTKGFTATIDSDDFVRLSQFNWRYHNGYAARTTSRTAGKRTTVLMHREVMGEIPEGMDIDHINGNKSDNRKSNLRLATREQNMQNAGAHYTNGTGYKGVSYDTRRSMYRARINVKGKETWLGYFSTPHDAARMYNFWALDLYGEFARLNAIEEETA